MAPVEVKDDYYDALKISNTATASDITTAFRRLAREIHPDKKPNDPGATAAFQLLARAYETLKDPDSRRQYDVKWVFIRCRNEAEERQKEPRTRDHEKEGEQTLRDQKEREIRRGRLQKLQAQRLKYSNEIFEIDRAVKEIMAQMRRLQEQEDECARKESARNGWWGYFMSPIYGQVAESEEEKREREMETLHRLHSRAIKETEKSRKERRLQELNDLLRDVITSVAAVEEEEEKAARIRMAKLEQQKMAEQQRKFREQEERRAEQEALRKRQEQEMRERARKEAAERAEREAREQQEFQEFQERFNRAREQSDAQERARRAQEESDAKERAQRVREAYGKHKRDPATSRPFERQRAGGDSWKTSPCSHEKFWPKLEGSHRCSNCHQVQSRFAFQCPDCGKVACANCRRLLRGKTPQSRRPFGAN